MTAGRFNLACMRVLARLPLPVLRALGWVLGQVIYVLAKPRRKIALRNLELCFPEASAAQRRAWARETFVRFCQAWLDRSWLWMAPRSVVEKRLEIHGALDELEGDTPTIILAPHFLGMDAAGTAPHAADRPGLHLHLHPASRSGHRCLAVRGPPALRQRAHAQPGRRRQAHPERAAQGGLLYLLPDMDFGPNDSVFVPFYGMSAATITSLSRFARLGRAKVVPLIGRITPRGYSAEMMPAWQNYPTDDIEADTARMNRELQQWIDTMPGQYYWVHRRFKSRPAGEPSVYR
ncbi:lipid A biosynthesis acyltransferase [Acidovorax citrulli]|nr:lipid A biosynthesis acyltransferase [Paracidovorax citrulli]